MNNVAKKPRVFAIDDNPTDLIMARLLLTQQNCEPILHEDQAWAVRELEHDTPDLILLDIEMPGLSGIDCLKRIRRMPHLRQVPIVMATGRSEMSDVKDAISHGANDYIVKPLDPEIFKTKLNRLLKQKMPSSSDQQDWVEYNLAQTSQTVQLQVDVEIISIGELGLTLQTKASIPVGFQFYVQLPFLKEIEIPMLPLSVLSCIEKDGLYIIKCNIIGLPERDLQKIRLFCKTLAHQKAS